MAGKMKLTPSQIRVLQLAVTGGRIFYYSKGDTTMAALGRKGFATFDGAYGRTYGRAHWWITDAGMATGRAHLASSGKDD